MREPLFIPRIRVMPRRSSWLGLAAAVMVLLGAGGSAQALDRAVGRVVRDDGASCTGTLVAPDTVLTAAHCLFRKSGDEPVKATALTFRAGAAGDRETARVAVKKVRLPASYRFNPKPESLTEVRCDVAWLTLARPVEITPLALADHVPEESFDAIGYPSYAPRYQSKQHGCTFAKRTTPDGIWATTCFAFPGVSGAPLLTPARPPRVFGVIVGRWNRASVAVPVGASEDAACGR